MTDNYKHSEITEIIIKAFYNVYNKLGYGFLEKVYEKSLEIECRKLGLKAASAITAEHEIELVNYLKATEIEVGLLLNLGKKPEFKRKVFSSAYRD